MAPRSETAADRRWRALDGAIVRCRDCPRLAEHVRQVAQVKRRMFRGHDYWGKAVPGFGDRRGRILILGLAPGAHGANRTGRMFTGDRSGEWLYGALHRCGLANRGESVSRDDGLVLHDAYITNVCRCAPPGNRPTSAEMEQCRRFLDREVELLDRVTVAVALGKIAWDAAWRRAARVDPGGLPRPRPQFGHGAEARLAWRAGEEIPILGSYHPSQQNTQTGRLTRPMLDSVFRRAVALSKRSLHR